MVNYFSHFIRANGLFDVIFVCSYEWAWKGIWRWRSGMTTAVPCHFVLLHCFGKYLRNVVWSYTQNVTNKMNVYIYIYISVYAHVEHLIYFVRGHIIGIVTYLRPGLLFYFILIICIDIQGQYQSKIADIHIYLYGLLCNRSFYFLSLC